MLLELNIKNFALIDEVDLKFSKGLNILTGETGAGKSIIIDSINFLLGEKQSKDIIRQGKDFAYVEGVFECTNLKLKEILQEAGIDVDDVLIISREINSSGKSLSRVNGKTVTASFLKKIGKFIIDIHGQHEHQSLLDEDNYVHILDAFCNFELEPIKREYRYYFEKLNEIEKNIEDLRRDEQYKLQKLDILSFQIDEIERANLKIGEDEELTKRRNLLANSEKIYSTLANVYERLYQKSEGYSAFDEISSSLSQLENIARFDEEFVKIKEDLEEVYYKLEDVIERIRDFKDKIEYNPEELNIIEERLDLISKLKRKYGNNIQDILNFYDKIKIEYENIQRSEEILEDLLKEHEKCLEILNDLAGKITNIRRETAKKLSEKIEYELRYLGLEKARFYVEVLELDKFFVNGKNAVNFLFCANPGEQLKKLNKVASGGEISRIMLAIKSVIAKVDEIPTLIFDEIDTGISGRAAQAVAEKMCLISKDHQILCVTHLPQIAVMADNHFMIKKILDEDTTKTIVKKLDDKERINEIARMVGGAIVTELTFKHANEMISIANQLKSTIKANGN
ncbi:DNA repair protein RecN (Recombination protein N) [Caloramator fervidus]|uniref:DNA repair protein RecN n=1 Tax=Caloramator fervidus TaxID=29344 RepID=A0A1H5V775_9CLOT|nr:DNA repair protein RecN [Caloramator fervidus]SEF82608.1 DNA repair protein RecN (Recombination protein N) [Caloramator fervidus]